MRFTSNMRDKRKGRKAWEKELITKNTNVYEFLRLVILNSTLSYNERNEEEEVGKVSFQVLVRKRSDGAYMPFQVALKEASLDDIMNAFFVKGDFHIY